MNGARPAVLSTLITGLCVWLVAGIPAQEAATVAEITSYLEAASTQPLNAYMRMHQQVTVDGVEQGEDITDMWLRDIEHFRLERDNGTVVVFTPEDVKMHLGQAGVMLHVPGETLEELGNDRGRALRQVGLTEPRLFVSAILSHSEALAVTGEDVTGEEECWVLTAPEAAFPAWLSTLSDLPVGSHITSVQVALGKTAPLQLELRITFPEIEEALDIPDEVFALDAPDGVVVVEWTVGKSVAQIRDELQRAQGGE